ncbi:MAG: hypothetical protein M3Z23_10125 [Acidobacteriota bacterium]|nr:hypothetical protein [Acidobacteriota bacterium]
MSNLRYPETAFAASAILAACERGDFRELNGHLGCPADSVDWGERERREVIEEIVSRIDGENWECYKGLLGHLARAPGYAGSSSIQ